MSTKLITALFLTIITLCSCKDENTNKKLSPIKDNKTKTNPINNTNKLESIDTTTCLHTESSSHFKFETYIERHKNNLFDSCITIITPILKNDKTHKQKITIKSDYYFSDVFMNCNNVRSYSTNINDTVTAMDNDYGDFVVADFNFDNRDDFAIKVNSGGNGGPEYDYYLQTPTKNFIRSDYLSDSMTFFPSDINIENKNLTTLVHADANHLGKHIYHYEEKKQTWIETSHEFINAYDEN